jgi:hypothetical protein
MGDFKAVGTAFEAFSTAVATPGAGAHVLKFQGLNVSGDNTMFIDDVRLVAVQVYPPTIGDIADRTIAEDGNTGALAFTVGDVETPAGSLTLGKNSSNTTLVPLANIVFGGSGANRTVTVTPAANKFGTATITVTVTDADGGTAQDAFLLTVTDDARPHAVHVTPTWDGDVLTVEVGKGSAANAAARPCPALGL